MVTAGGQAGLAEADPEEGSWAAYLDKTDGEDAKAAMARLDALLNVAVEKGMIPQKRIGAIKKKIEKGKRTVEWFVRKWETKLKKAGHDEL